MAKGVVVPFSLDALALNGGGGRWPGKRPIKPRWDEQEGCVYFIQNVVGGLVKIGYTSFTVRRRLNQIEHQISQGLPNRVELVALLSIRGPFSLERQIHNMFPHLCSRGEWFKPTLELSDFIVRHGGNPLVLEV